MGWRRQHRFPSFALSSSFAELGSALGMCTPPLPVYMLARAAAAVCAATAAGVLVYVVLMGAGGADGGENVHAHLSDMGKLANTVHAKMQWDVAAVNPQSLTLNPKP